MTAAALFRDVGPALFGSSWQSEMARYLKVNPRTVRRWVSGTDVPGDWLLDALRKRSQEKQDEMRRLEAVLLPLLPREP